MNTRTKKASLKDYAWFLAMLTGMALLFSNTPISELGWLLVVAACASMD